MRSLLKGLCLSCLLLSLTGCASVVGHWNLESVKPKSAESEFQMSMMCLAKDGSYMACAKYGGEMKKFAGTYKYDDGDKTLTFKGDDGKERTYQVELKDSEMKVTEKGKDWVAMMKKGECPCGKACGGAKCDPAKCCAKECPMKGEGKPMDSKKIEVKKGEKADKADKGEKKAEPKKDKDKDKEAKPGDKQ